MEGQQVATADGDRSGVGGTRADGGFGQENGAPPSIIALERVGYAYPSGTQALTDVSLEVLKDSIVAVVGPSGCGKSTLLSLLAGLTKPSSGIIRWPTSAGGSQLRLPTGVRRLTMVFQKDTVLPWLTVKGNVGFGLRILKLDRETIKQRVTWLLKLAGLEEFAGAYPYQLSGGMRRRVAFLAAVAPLPAVLLLDEPFSALDEPTRIGIHQEAHRIIRDVGMSVVLVTHDIGEAISFSDRVYLLSRRPGTVADYFDVPFGAQRNMLALRETPEFLQTYREIWHGLSGQITSEAPPGADLQE